MRQKTIKTIIISIVLSLCICTLALIVEAKSLVPYHAWQFHELDMEYVTNSMKLASRYNINTVVFSHDMLGSTSQLFDETDRGDKLRRLAKEAHGLGLRVWIWVRELDDVPDRFLDENIVQLDRAGFWDWLTKRYQKVFTEYPEFDGLMLTFHESQYKIFTDTQVESKLSKPDRFTKMINTINQVCAKFKKDFIVRTFVYEPIELEWLKQGLEKTDSRVMVQSKCVPHDWDPYYPHEPLIGAFPKRQQIIEFDGSSEFTGKNRIPYTSPEYFAYRWRYDLAQPGVAGYNARVDHGGYDALSTPNEINLYTLYRLTEDAKLTADDIWKEWTVMHYGSKAAPAVENALKPAFQIVNQSFYPLKFWITNHSKLPTFDYAQTSISARSLAKWYPKEPKYKELEHRLKHPDSQILQMIIAEKAQAIAQAEKALQELSKAKPFLKASQFNDLHWRLDLLHRVAIIWKLHAQAFFGYKILAEGNEVSGLRDQVERAIDKLYDQADISANNPMIGDAPPGSANEIITVADELKAKLDDL